MSSRREFIKKSVLLGAGALGTVAAARAALFQTEKMTQQAGKFTLLPLPYSYDALEPHLDKMTMELHHSRHHQAYVNNLNKALETSTDTGSLEELMKNISKYPAAVRNNGGGHYNHSLFWKLMKPSGSGAPRGALADAIKSTFDSFEDFKTIFSEAALKRFGSGWTWLIVNKDKKLEIGSTPNQDNPLMDLSGLKGTPVLALDVWEHAYYLKYQNKRTDYINSWWNVVNWEEAGKMFKV